MGYQASTTHLSEQLSRLPSVAASCRRFWLIVLDGVGIGSSHGLPWQGDPGADTLGRVAAAAGGLALPNLDRLGLRDLHDLPSDRPQPRIADDLVGTSARLIPLSLGKDTLTGHWELAGLVTDTRLQTFPDGLPQRLLQQLGDAFGRGVLGGMPASGTRVIEEFGAEHLATGRPIVYTSADSVLQIAAHEAVVPLAELYRFCELARKIAQGEWLVGRVIARPFTGEPGSFQRIAAGRRDYSLKPPAPTVLDACRAAGIEVVAIGKITDVFAGQGISRSLKPPGNRGVLDELSGIKAAPAGADRQLVFANLNDFDSLYGHRRDAKGFAAALEEFDAALAGLMPASSDGSEILAVTADHGCDPLYGGTDHTRETVPLFVAGTGWPPACLEPIYGLTAVAGMIAAAFGLEGFGFWPRKPIAEEI